MGVIFLNFVWFDWKFTFIVIWWCRFHFLYYFFKILDSWPPLGVGWPHPFWREFIFQLRPILLKICIFTNFMVLISFLMLFCQNFGLLTPLGASAGHTHFEGVIIQCCLIWLKFCMYGNLMVLISFLILFFQNFGFLTPFRRRLATPILTAVHISTSSNSAENLYFYLFYGADFIFNVIL